MAYTYFKKVIETTYGDGERSPFYADMYLDKETGNVQLRFYMDVINPSRTNQELRFNMGAVSSADNEEETSAMYGLCQRQTHAFLVRIKDQLATDLEFFQNNEDYVADHVGEEMDYFQETRRMGAAILDDISAQLRLRQGVLSKEFVLMQDLAMSKDGRETTLEIKCNAGPGQSVYNWMVSSIKRSIRDMDKRIAYLDEKLK